MTDAELRQLFEAWYLELGQTDACSPVPLLWIGAQEPSWVWQEDAAGRFMLSGARAMERQPRRRECRAGIEHAGGSDLPTYASEREPAK
jgi:hypothetical protein